MEPPTQERLQVIRDTDAMAGENLQMSPLAWQQRRELLAYIDATNTAQRELTARLSKFLEPYSGGTHVLSDLVERMEYANRIASEIRREVADIVTPSPCCANEKRNMNGGCDNCGAPCL